jgi:hypothetical protein
MISKTTIRRMNAAALLLAAVVIEIAALHLFRHNYRWIEYSIIVIAATLSIIASTTLMRRRRERKQAIKATHASLLKHQWELRHKREW